MKRLMVVGVCIVGFVSVVLFFQATKQTSTLPSFILENSIRTEEPWTLVATGDVIPARSVNTQTIKRNDFTWGWKNIAPILQQGDITLINLESPLLSNCVPTDEGMKFCGDARHVEGIVFAGVDVVSLANNHAGNYGIEGILETIEILKMNGLPVTGTDTQPYSTTVKNIRVGFLAYNDIGYKEQGIAWADEELMKKEIQETKEKSDVVVVSMSWGVEYEANPSMRQQELAHAAVDAGADLIIGNHPHWIQPTEKYKDGFITYAHGNTIFDQMWSEETKIGVIGKYTFVGKKLETVEFIPIYIQEYGQPILLQGAAKEKIVRQF
ncbi:MAG: CapA family protein [Microgenomates group bacterium]